MHLCVSYSQHGNYRMKGTYIFIAGIINVQRIDTSMLRDFIPILEFVVVTLQKLLYAMDGMRLPCSMLTAVKKHTFR